VVETVLSNGTPINPRVTLRELFRVTQRRRMKFFYPTSVRIVFSVGSSVLFFCTLLFGGEPMSRGIVSPPPFTSRAVAKPSRIVSWPGPIAGGARRV
jgi:hypothetical protein